MSDRTEINRANVAYYALQTIVGELKGVKQKFEGQYKDDMANPWAVDLLTHYTTDIDLSAFSDSDRTVDNLDARTQAKKEKWGAKMGEWLDKVPFSNSESILGKKYKKKIREAVDEAADLVGALEHRVHIETDALLKAAQNGNYTTAQELVENEFYKADPFKTEGEYKQFLEGYMGHMKKLFDTAFEISQRGPEWESYGFLHPIKKANGKAASSKVKSKLGDHLDKLKIEHKTPNLKKLPEDVDLIRTKLFDMYQAREYEIMTLRGSQ